MELLLGCGFQRTKLLVPPGSSSSWQELVTCDSNPNCKPDVICNLDTGYSNSWIAEIKQTATRFIEHPPYLTRIGFFKENFFAEVHAYEVLEHLGSQGDASSFFNTFTNIYRVLVPGGYLCASVPSRFSPWLWGDPGHRRVIYPESLSFLDQTSYNQLGFTAQSDYRYLYQGDFNIVSSVDDKTFHKFILQAVKPSRLKK